MHACMDGPNDIYTTTITILRSVGQLVGLWYCQNLGKMFHYGKAGDLSGVSMLRSIILSGHSPPGKWLFPTDSVVSSEDKSNHTVFLTPDTVFWFTLVCVPHQSDRLVFLQHHDTQGAFPNCCIRSLAGAVNLRGRSRGGYQTENPSIDQPLIGCYNIPIFSITMVVYCW